MTLDDETAGRIADETWAKRGKRHTVSGEEYVRAGWDARDAEVEELRATLAKVRRLADQWNDTPPYRGTSYDEGRVDQRTDMTMRLLAILDESPTERETPAGSHEFEEVIVAPYVVRCAVCGDAKHPHHDTRAAGAQGESGPCDGCGRGSDRCECVAGPWGEVVPDDRA